MNSIVAIIYYRQFRERITNQRDIDTNIERWKSSETIASLGFFVAYGLTGI